MTETPEPQPAENQPAAVDLPSDADATEPETAKEDASTPAKSALRRHLPLALAAVGCLAATAVATVFGLHDRDLTAREQARTDALRAACDYGPVLANYDAKTIDGYFGAVLAGATGAWQKEFDSTSKDLREVLIQGQVTSKATDVQCALKTATADTADALVAITQTISSAGTSGQPRTGQLTIGLSLRQVDGRWLIDKVDSPQLPKPQQ
ncbi:hypothetical protein ABZ319_00680 [Nocardia sp. NPDC005978]|uniref:hypothetical protein n=1 Tax=Nocardia sp. NPDC005978 TaxID=3156725 RepID=UPI0033A8A6B2